MEMWTAELVARRFEECMDTLRKLPAGVGAGCASSWPEVLRTPQELARHEPQPTRLMATPQQITRMEETLTWIVWVPEEYRKLIWLRAQRYSWRAISRETCLPKTTVQRCWQVALFQVVKRLNRVSVPA